MILFFHLIYTLQGTSFYDKNILDLDHLESLINFQNFLCPKFLFDKSWTLELFVLLKEDGHLTL